MKKIFHLISSLQLGGAENVAIQICKNKPSQQEEITLSVVELYRTTSAYEQQKREDLATSGIEIISLSTLSKRWGLMIAPFRLYQLIVQQQPNIIHSHTDLPDFVLSTAIRLLRISGQAIPNIVRTIHNVELWPTHPVIGKYTEKAFVNDKILAVSEAALKAYNTKRKEYLLPISEAKVIYNGSTPGAQEILSELALNQQKINIAFCGRFVPQKGVDFLINCIKNNSDQFSGINLYFIGSGEFENDIWELAKQHDTIFVTNPIQNIATKIANFDYIIMPSRFEGLGIVSIEASFAKVPVIAARAPGLSETLPMDWELFFEVDNEQELCAILQKIISKSYNREDLISKAYSYVDNKFKENVMIEEYFQIYSQL